MCWCCPAVCTPTRCKKPDVIEWIARQGRQAQLVASVCTGAFLLAEAGSCLIPADQPIPLKETFEEELRYFLGDENYEQL